MIFKKLIFCLLSSHILIQTLADHGSELIPEEHQLPCDKKIAWFKNITTQTKKLYDEYSKMFDETKPSHVKHDDNMIETSKHILAEHDQFDHNAAELFEKYESDSEQLHLMSNSSARLAFCQKEIKWYRLMNTNLTSIATDLKSDVLKALDHMGVAKEIKDSFDKTLSRLVNFLFIIDLTKNLYKEIAPLVKQSWNTAEDGIALEKEWKINANNELEPARNVVTDYDDGVIETDEEKAVDKQIEENVHKLDDNTDVKAAEEKVAEVEHGEVEEGKEVFEEGEMPIEPFEFPVVALSD